MGKKSKKQKQTAKSSRQVGKNNAELGAPKIVTAVAAEAAKRVADVPVKPKETAESYPVVQVDEPESSNADELNQESGKKERNKKLATVNKTKADQVNKPESQDNVCSTPGVVRTTVKPDMKVNHDKENTDATYPLDLVKASKVAEAQEVTKKDGAVVRMEESFEIERNDRGKKKRNKKKKADRAKETSNTVSSKMKTTNQVEVQPTTCQEEDVPKVHALTAKPDVNSGSQIQHKTTESAVTNSRDKLKQAVEATSELENKTDAKVSVPVSEGDKPNIIEREKVQKRKYSRRFLLDILKTATLVRPQLRCPELATITPHKQPVVFERPPESLNRANRPIDRSQKRAFLGLANENVILHKSSAAWQTTRKEASKDEVDSVVQKLRGFLNKLSPENFDKILSDIRGMSFDTLAKLVGFAKVLFEKAVLEPRFSPTYARLAFNMLSLSVEEGDKTVDFRTLLIRECQKEFEKDKIDDEKILCELAEKISVAETDAEKKLLKEKEMAVLMTKKRSIGNIKFIGELFKLKILSEAIMHTCINKLMQKPEDEESMECVCQLLGTIGKIMDSKSKAKVDNLMNELDQLVAKNKTSSRIRFLIMNVIDLRKSGWIQKNIEVPTTIEQVHRNAEIEKQRSMTYDKSRPFNKSGTSERTAGAYQVTTQGINQRLLRDFMAFNAKQGKYENNAKDEGDDIMKLKPDWKKSKNKFEVLKTLCADKDEEKPQKKMCVKQFPGNESSGTAEKSFKNMVRVESENHAASSSTAPDQNVIPLSEMELKVKSRIDEFLSLKDMNEALESIKELNTEACYTNAVRFFYISLSQNFAKSSEVRNQIGQLHRNVIEKKIAPIEAYVDAAIKFSIFANGMVIDIPQVWTYVSEIATPVVMDSELIKMDAFARVSTSADAELDKDLSIGEGDHVALLLAAILSGMSSGKGKETAEQLWADAGLQWESLLKHSTVEEFRQNYLRF